MTTPTPAPVDLNNIQGDIIGGLPKKTQTLLFFVITNGQTFKQQLKGLIPHIKSSAQVEQDRVAIREHKKSVHDDKEGCKPHLIPIAGVNVAFSHWALPKLGINEQSSDSFFNAGQLAGSQDLGDTGKVVDGKFVPNWDAPFKKEIDGVFLITGESHESVNKEINRINHIFGVGTPHCSIKEVTTVRGDVRPGDQSGHEHFGFLDGISNPSIKGIDPPLPSGGPKQVPPSSILVGQDGSGPAWAKDGSFLVFRHLRQRVPEFDKFLKQNPIDLPGLPRDKGSELLGARLVGRWKSGAPIDITPLEDNPALALENTFRFEGERTSQTKCPFAAHIRKTFPRADLEDQGVPLDNFRIMRRGITFGPEVTKDEKRVGKTGHARGLIFICYQAQINAFHTIQKTWSNTPTFPPGSQEVVPPALGIDPIVGQTGGDASKRTMTGFNPQDVNKSNPFPEFVTTHGGEYFFSPSIQSLKTIFSA